MNREKIAKEMFKIIYGLKKAWDEFIYTIDGDSFLTLADYLILEVEKAECKARLETAFDIKDRAENLRRFLDYDYGHTYIDLNKHCDSIIDANRPNLKKNSEQ